MRKMIGILIAMILLVQTLVAPGIVIAEGADDDAQIAQAEEPAQAPEPTDEPKEPAAEPTPKPRRSRSWNRSPRRIRCSTRRPRTTPRSGP